MEAGTRLGVTSSSLESPAFQQNARLGRASTSRLGCAMAGPRTRQFKEHHFKLSGGWFQHVRINLHPLRDGKRTPPAGCGRVFKTMDWAVDQALANQLLVILDFHDDWRFPRSRRQAEGVLDAWPL